MKMKENVQQNYQKYQKKDNKNYDKDIMEENK